jgi:hypothetical protein
MPGKTTSKWVHKPAMISDEAYEHLAKKYHVPRTDLEKMAAELRLGRPKLEIHLIVLAAEKKKKPF